MPNRPPGLPDFKSPPVTEVVLGVQFNSIEGFLAPHLGLVWQAFKADFPTIEERPPLPAAFETFGDSPRSQPITLHFGGAHMPRVFFINTEKTELLQIQRDRFIHNWRKLGSGDSYPRFEKMVATFQSGYKRLQEILSSLGLSPVVPNQCDVAYINQIEIPAGKTAFEVLADVLGGFRSGLQIEDSGSPEDATVSFRYVIRSIAEKPIGRLTVTVQPAKRADGKNVLQLNLVARGAPETADAAGVIDFLEIGRVRIVRAFTQLTTGNMHNAWERVS